MKVVKVFAPTIFRSLPLKFTFNFAIIDSYSWCEIFAKIADYL